MTIFYSSLIRIPSTVNCLFENKSNIKIIWDLAINSYPLSIQNIACNILTVLSRNIAFHFFGRDFEEMLETLFTKISAYRSSAESRFKLSALDRRLLPARSELEDRHACNLEYVFLVLCSSRT